MDPSRHPCRRTGGAAVAILLLAALLPLLPGSPAQAVSAFGTTVVNQANGNCVEVPGGAATNALQLVQAGCGAGARQTFTVTPVAGTTDRYTITTLTPGSCLDIYGASTADNAAVIQYTCHGGINQQFRLVANGAAGTVNLAAVSSGKCVAPVDDGGAAGTALVQLPCTSAASRTWRLTGYPGGANGLAYGE